MSTADGTGVEEVLAEILTHKPERVEKEKTWWISGPLSLLNLKRVTRKNLARLDWMASR